MNQTLKATSDKLLEQAVIAGLMLNGKDAAKYIQKLQVSSFTSFFYQDVFRAMQALIAKNEPIDIITLKQENPAFEYDALGNLIILPEKYDPVVFTTLHLDKYVKLLLDLEVRRMATEGWDAKEIADRLTRMSYNGSDKFLTPNEAAEWFAAEYKAGTMRQSGILFPFARLNEATKGIQPGQLVVVGARPSVGKSTFLQNIAVEANRQNKRVLFGTAEMSIMMTAQRVLSQLLEQNMFLDEGKLDPDIIKATLSMSQIYYHQFSSTAELEEQIREHRQEIDLVLVDYIQIIEPKGKYKSQFEKTGMVVNDLVQLKNKYNLPIVAASQFNRNANDQQPTMADFYESGKIEQAADVILSLWQHQDDKEDSTPDIKKVRIDLLKNRNGQILVNFYKNRDNQYNQEFVLFFHGERFVFEEPDKGFLLPTSQEHHFTKPLIDTVKN